MLVGDDIVLMTRGESRLVISDVNVLLLCGVSVFVPTPVLTMGGDWITCGEGAKVNGSERLLGEGACAVRV